MKHPDFSVKRVEGFRCEPGKKQSLYWDGYAPGLGVRVTAGGSKSYIFETWLHGRSVRLTIGDHRTWILGKAQGEATRLKSLTDQGKDPRQIKRDELAAVVAVRAKAAGEAVLVGQAWNAYMEHHAEIWGNHHLRAHREVSHSGGVAKKRGTGTTKPGALIPILQMRLATVTVDVLTDWLKAEAARPRNSARLAFSLFRTFWSWCATRKEYKSMVDVRILDDKDLRREVPKARTKKFDVLERAHLNSWFAAVRELSNPVPSAFLQALILTGTRKEEMAELKWADVDFKWNALWIKDKIEDAGRKIPLPPYLASLIAKLPRDGQWVFSSEKSAKGKLAEPRSAHKRALAIAGLHHVSINGLRRTFASLAEWVEMPTGIVAQIQGHKPSATAEKHYINRPLELLAVWHNKFEAWILEEAEVKWQKPRSTAKKPIVKAPPKLRLVGNR